MELPQPGTLFLSKYRVDGVLGEGGFSRVFLAVDTAGRRVALKVLLPDDGDRYSAETTARFKREVKVLGSLRDVHTVTMYESGTSAEGLLYIVFEFVPGRDLAEILREHGRLQPDVVKHVMRQVLSSLREAHNAGLLHRDIKPENIRIFEYLDDPWSTKLLDFGVAKSSISDERRITKTGQLVGTPRYMSPEQLLDLPLTPASDIYALGLVMLEALLGPGALGENTWSGQLERLQTGYLFGMPEVERIGPRFHDVLQRMVSRDPAQRLQTTDAVLAALDDASHTPRPSDSSLERPASAVDATRPTSTSHRALFVVAAVLVGAAVGLGALALQMADENPQQQPVEPPARVPTGLVKGAESAGTAGGDASTFDVARALDAAASVADGSFDDATPLASLPSGCGERPPFRGLQLMEAREGLDLIRWHAHIPAEYDPDTHHAVVIVLHPDHIQAGRFLRDTRLDRLADKHGFVALAPFVGEQQAWRSPEDVDFVWTTLKHSYQQLCIDGERIFAVGHNNSGFAIEQLACKPWITAVATNSYRPETESFLCDENMTKPFIALSGLHTTHAPVDGGVNCYGTRKVSLDFFEESWRERNGCRGSARTVEEHDGSVCQTWKCDTPFVACRLDGGLGWPGSSPRQLADWGRCDGTPPDFPTEDVVWSFFDRVADTPSGRHRAEP